MIESEQFFTFNPNEQLEYIGSESKLYKNMVTNTNKLTQWKMCWLLQWQQKKKREKEIKAEKTS